MVFVKGDPDINREGRPVGARGMTTRVRDALEKYAELKEGGKKEIMTVLAEKAIKMALNGDGQMLKIIWNYLDGMPKQNMELKINPNDENWEKDRVKLEEILKEVQNGKIQNNSETVGKAILQK